MLLCSHQWLIQQTAGATLHVYVGTGCTGVFTNGDAVTVDNGHTGVVRVTVQVRPGSARPGVGGEHDGALVVRVSA